MGIWGSCEEEELGGGRTRLQQASLTGRERGPKSLERRGGSSNPGGSPLRVLPESWAGLAGCPGTNLGNGLWMQEVRRGHGGRQIPPSCLPSAMGGPRGNTGQAPVFAPALCTGAHGLPRWPRPLMGLPSDLQPRERPADPPTWGCGAERGEAPTGEGKKPHPNLSLHPGARGEAGKPAWWWGRKVCQLPLWSEVLSLSSALFPLRRQ